MLNLFTTSLMVGFVAAQTGPAAKVTNNVYGDYYSANLDSGPGLLTGRIGIGGAIDGHGVRVSLDFSGFNLTDSLEYSYHIHERSVPSDGNCTGTGKHMDKHAVGDDFVCDPSQSSLCQLGDLSGKHGIIRFNSSDDNSSLSVNYQEDYLSTTSGEDAFFGNLSIVVHRKSDKFRLACGNFKKMESPTNGTSSNSTTTTWPNSTSTEVVTTSTQVATAIPPSTSTATTIVEQSSTPSPSGTTGLPNPQNGRGVCSAQLSQTVAVVLGVGVLALVLQ